MTTFQGLLRKNIINANTQFERLGYVSNNVANMNTTAYKGVSFEQYLTADGYLTGVVRNDRRAGKLVVTGNKFDFGIQGQGFVPVTSENGEVRYTRDGVMKQNKDGYLITTDGYLIGDGIKMPVNYEDFSIKSNGDVMVTMVKGEKPIKIGTIPVVIFQNPDELKALDGNKFAQTLESGEPLLLVNHDRVAHQKLESSNVNTFKEVQKVMRLNASMLASMKMINVINDMYEKSINLQG